MKFHKQNDISLAVEIQLKEEFYHVQDVVKVSVDAHDANWNRWRKSLRNEMPCHIPSPRPVVECGMILSQLPKSNPRGVFAGKFVGCCMHPQGFASPCAWHGHESPNGAFWVVEFNNWIVAAAWVWRYENRLVVDSVDIHKDFTDSRELIHEMYVCAAQSVVGVQNVERVYAGIGYLETWKPNHWFIRDFNSPAPYRFNGQTLDDSYKLHIIAGKAAPYL